MPGPRARAQWWGLETRLGLKINSVRVSASRLFLHAQFYSCSHQERMDEVPNLTNGAAIQAT